MADRNIYFDKRIEYLEDAFFGVNSVKFDVMFGRFMVFDGISWEMSLELADSGNVIFQSCDLLDFPDLYNNEFACFVDATGHLNMIKKVDNEVTLTILDNTDIVINSQHMIKGQSGTDAMIGGSSEYSSETRGLSALDIQSYRLDGSYIASGDSSIAVGHSNRAKYEYSTAFGVSNSADASGSICVGTSNITLPTAHDSVLVGHKNSTNISNSHIMGMNNELVGDSSDVCVLGNNNCLNCESVLSGATIIGVDNAPNKELIGSGSVTIGNNNSDGTSYYNNSVGYRATIVGNHLAASKSYSTVLGEYSRAYSALATVVGSGCNTGTASHKATMVGSANSTIGPASVCLGSGCTAGSIGALGTVFLGTGIYATHGDTTIIGGTGFYTDGSLAHGVIIGPNNTDRLKIATNGNVIFPKASTTAGDAELVNGGFTIFQNPSNDQLYATTKLNDKVVTRPIDGSQPPGSLIQVQYGDYSHVSGNYVGAALLSGDHNIMEVSITPNSPTNLLRIESIAHLGWENTYGGLATTLSVSGGIVDPMLATRYDDEYGEMFTSTSIVHIMPAQTTETLIFGLNFKTINNMDSLLFNYPNYNGGTRSTIIVSELQA